MSVWWTLDQALFWIAMRDMEYVAAADGRPRRANKAERSAWLHFLLGEEDGGLPGGMRMHPDEARDALLDAIVEEKIAAKFQSSSPEQAEPSWFNHAALEYETQGQDDVARLRWSKREAPAAGLPEIAYVVVLASDMQRVFPDMLVELEQMGRDIAPEVEAKQSASPQQEPPQEVVPPLGALIRKRGQPSFEGHDAKLYPEIKELLRTGKATSVIEAARMVAKSAGDRMQGKGNEENSAKRLSRHYLTYERSKPNGNGSQ